MANIIKQLQDADGNNIYPIAYAQGGVKMDLLWTNPNPTSNFSNQTIALPDLAEYDFYRLKSKNTASGNGYMTYIIFAGERSITSMPISCKFSWRPVTISNNSAVFEDCMVSSTYAGTASADNSNMIPIEIYGIKMSYIVPTTVQGLQYVELVNNESSEL